MQLSLNLQQLELYCFNLLTNYFPDNYSPEYPTSHLFQKSIQRLEFCFSHIHSKYYYKENKIQFDHLNSDHFAIFLYFLSNTVWKETQDTELPTRLFYLNKVMHGIDLFYSIKMPDIFLLIHPLGTVLGNASYSDYFVAYQNVTVGSNGDGVYPKFGTGTILYSKSSVIGDCLLGDDVIFGANSLILNTNVPDKTIVVGQHPSYVFVPNQISVIKRIFNKDI